MSRNFGQEALDPINLIRKQKKADPNERIGFLKA
jgi:hypothetical protein